MNKINTLELPYNVVIFINNKKDRKSSIQKALMTHEDKFIMKKRVDETNEDNFKTHFMRKYLGNSWHNFQFCKLQERYIIDALNSCDFFIFINDPNYTLKEYNPVCVAFIKIKTRNKYKILYISIFCSDKKYGLCGGRLMTNIKYVATLLGCNRIELESVSDPNTMRFYEMNGFVRENEYTLDYFYEIREPDYIYKESVPIVGTATIIGDTSVSSRRSNKINTRKRNYFSQRSRSKTWRSVKSKERNSI